jgi:two-component system response regulator NreC
MITVLLADDHTILRQGLIALLATAPDIQVIGQADNGLEVLKLMEKLSPTVLVLDINMPDLNGFVVAEQVQRQYKHTQIVMLSMYKNVAYAAESLRKGAKAYIIKDSSADCLLQAIRDAAQNKTYIGPPFTKAEVEQYQRKTRTGQLEPHETLTQREKIVFHLASNGLSFRHIAGSLDISERTVETHLQNIYRKLKINSQAELIRYAADHGLLIKEI